VTSASAGAWKAPRDWRVGRSAGRRIRPIRRARSISLPEPTAIAGFSRAGERPVSRGLRGTMGDLLLSLAHGRAPAISGRDNLKTLALVEAVYCAAREHRVVRATGIGAGLIVLILVVQASRLSGSGETPAPQPADFVSHPGESNMLDYGGEI